MSVLRVTVTIEADVLPEHDDQLELVADAVERAALDMYSRVKVDSSWGLTVDVEVDDIKRGSK